MRVLAAVFFACVFLVSACEGDDDDFFDADVVEEVGPDVSSDVQTDAEEGDADVGVDTAPEVDPDPPLDGEADFVRQQMDAGGLPGVMLAIVDRDGIRWSSMYGFQDVENEIPITAETLFPVASISKLIVGLLMMREVEAGTLDLDAPASDYLTHAFENPAHPGAPMTSRELLSHTSSLRDVFLLFTTGASPDDSSTPVGEFTERYVRAGGDFASGQFSGAAPGTTYAYCNAGFAVLGHVVEGASGVSFREGSNALTDALGFDGDFFFADVAASRVAVQYTYGPRGFAPLSLTEFLHYPAVGLKASVGDIAKLLRMYMRDGLADDDVTILSPESIAEMERVARPDLNPNRGLSLHRVTVEDVNLRGHGGAHIGSSADAWYTDDYGIIVMANSDAYVRERFGLSRGAEAMRTLRAWLVRRAEEIPR